MIKLLIKNNKNKFLYKRRGKLSRLFIMKKILVLILIVLLTISLSAEEKIGLALSGGGARALAHIGVLKVIDKKNIPIDYIAGTSIGAVVGGLYAMGYSAEKIEKIILDLEWNDILNDEISRDDVYISQKRWKPYANIFFDLDNNFKPNLPRAFVPGNDLINKLFALTYPVSTTRDFDELEIPFRCVSTNIITGKKKVFSNGSLHEVMRASMSFPSVISPFQLEDNLYIDGGITDNLPTGVVKNMGADFIIGVDASSDLKTNEELISLVDVLEQTVNVNISENIKKSRNICDVLIKIDLDNIDLLNFDKKEQIIAIGERAAQNYFSDLNYNFSIRNKIINNVTNTQKLLISDIDVSGNNYLSDRKIKEYVGLKPGERYSQREISHAIMKAYNSQLFRAIYPVISKIGEKNILKIKVSERKRKRLGFAFSYNSYNEMSAGLTLEMNNLIQHNSKLIANINIGDKKFIKFDYVKNFGKHYGIYFRLFPNLSERKIYSYNSDHEKTRSVRSLEMSTTAGIGLYASEAVIMEAYLYGFRKKLYKDIAEFDDTEFHSSGIGFKTYHESLDDPVFPMKGSEIMLKYSSAKEGVFSEDGNKKFFSKIKMLLPISDRVSLKYKFEYGSYFENSDVDYDPFFIGGVDSFLGLNAGELSAPIYKINTIALRIEPWRSFYCDMQFNILNLGNLDYWLPEENFYQGIGIKLGYKSVIGPLRLGAALDEEFKEYFYLSLGYEFDPFEFSNR